MPSTFVSGSLPAAEAPSPAVTWPASPGGWQSVIHGQPSALSLPRAGAQQAWGGVGWGGGSGGQLHHQPWEGGRPFWIVPAACLNQVYT